MGRKLNMTHISLIMHNYLNHQSDTIDVYLIVKILFYTEKSEFVPGFSNCRYTSTQGICSRYNEVTSVCEN